MRDKKSCSISRLHVFSFSFRPEHYFNPFSIFSSKVDSFFVDFFEEIISKKRRKERKKKKVS